MVSTRSRQGRPLPAPAPPRSRRIVPKYKPDDTAKRHRLPDRAAKGVAVVTHRRRKPAK